MSSAPFPWISGMVSGTTSQLRAGVALLRGLGALVAKSMLLALESKHPPRLRIAASVLLGAGAGPAPSSQLAVTP